MVVNVCERSPGRPKADELGKPTLGKKCTLGLSIPDIKLPGDLKDIKITVTDPDGNTSPVEPTCTPDNKLGMNAYPV